MTEVLSKKPFTAGSERYFRGSFDSICSKNAPLQLVGNQDLQYDPPGVRVFEYTVQ